jgi:hypothetical protein
MERSIPLIKPSFLEGDMRHGLRLEMKPRHYLLILAVESNSCGGGVMESTHVSRIVYRMENHTTQLTQISPKHAAKDGIRINTCRFQEEDAVIHTITDSQNRKKKLPNFDAVEYIIQVWLVCCRHKQFNNPG